ncbi:MAG: NAD(P)H-dependent oxidoreductase subunit E [Verrucomicrobiales bacterium]
MSITLPEEQADRISAPCAGTCSRAAGESSLSGEVDAMVARIGGRPEDLIPLLQAIQKKYNYLPKPALQRLSELTRIRPADITGVSTFYSQFRHYPVGKHIIKTCIGTACHVKGASVLEDTFRNRVATPKGEHTGTHDLFTVEEVGCLGCCMLAPVVQIDETIYGDVRPYNIPDLLTDFLASQQDGSRDGDETAGAESGAIGDIRICVCSSCVAGGSGVVYEELQKLVGELALPARVKTVGCTGFSYQTPLVEVSVYNDKRYRYGQVGKGDVRALLLRHFRPASWARRAGARVFHLLESFHTDESWDPPTRYSKDVRDSVDARFEGPQKRFVTEHAGILDPVSIEDYLAHDGFVAMETCLKEKTREEVIEEIKNSGLRGRGGAGFSTGLKWGFAHDAPGDRKYIICNGDEGDPGAFMDRMILESFPYRVLEGMVIAAHAIGASEGFLYIRAEYPLATERINHAIAICEEHGYLGSDIIGTGFSLKLQVVEGAGAFVCGEETALMSAIEGGRGMPRFRPPFPAQSGLWGKPTLINNVETLGLVSWIIRNGASKFAALGTEKSKGTKTFALAGKVRRGGLIEVPMGMTIHEIVEEIGGGIPEGRKLKAVLMGGPSGGCVPAELAYTPVDYEEIVRVGAIMGSGGMVVLDDSDCMVDIARYFMSFTQDESCGKCTHCRIGTKRMLEILNRLCEGKGKKGDLEKLETLAGITIEGSLCGLGKTAPNPVFSSLKYFREEYEAHLNGVCPARKCTPLVQYFITDTCFGCTRCAQHCPVDAIPMNPYHHHTIEEPVCTRCDIYYQVCPVDAIKVIDL